MDYICYRNEDTGACSAAELEDFFHCTLEIDDEYVEDALCMDGYDKTIVPLIGSVPTIDILRALRSIVIDKIR